jgi:hypothetical protein
MGHDRCGPLGLARCHRHLRGDCRGVRVAVVSGVVGDAAVNADMVILAGWAVLVYFVLRRGGR